MEQKKEEEQNGRRRSLKLKAFGIELEVRGYDIVIVTLAGGVIGLCSFLYTGVSASQGEHKEIINHQVKQEEALNVMIYVLSLPQDKREALQLDMPAGLRSRVKQ